MTRVGAVARLLVIGLLTWSDGGRCIAAEAPPPLALTESLSVGGQARERFEAYLDDVWLWGAYATLPSLRRATWFRGPRCAPSR